MPTTTMIPVPPPVLLYLIHAGNNGRTTLDPTLAAAIDGLTLGPVTVDPDDLEGLTHRASTTLDADPDHPGVCDCQLCAAVTTAQSLLDGAS